MEVDSGIESESDHELTQQNQSTIAQYPLTQQEQVQAQQQYVEAQDMAVSA